MFRISGLVFLLNILRLLACVHSYQGMPDGVLPELAHLYNRGLENFEAPAEFYKRFPYFLSGYDEDHNPVWIWEFGKWDVVAILQEGKEIMDKFDKYVDQGVLRIYNSSFANDGSITPVIGIIDLEGYSIKQLSSLKTIEYEIPKLRLIVTCLGNLHSAYLVNTNFVAKSLLNLVKPLLGRYFEKIDVYGTNKALWTAKLLKTIPRDQLPSSYGGTEDFKPAKVF